MKKTTTDHADHKGSDAHTDKDDMCTCNNCGNMHKPAEKDML
jgi:hypothetical protein